MIFKIKHFLQNKNIAKPIMTALFIFSIIIMYTKHSDEIKSNIPKVAIETATAKIVDMPVYLTALGTVTPQHTANIVAQVTGIITKLHFQDGQTVKKDDILVEIDSRTYKAQLMQYEGQLLRDKALLDNANLDLQRYQELWKQNSVSKQILDTQIALVKQYEGIVKMDQGLVDSAQINLNYCLIKAPFDGQIGIRLLTEGNLVQPGNSAIAVMNLLDPIFVVFSVPELDLPNITKEKKLSVDAYDQNNKHLLETGELKAIDNQIDTTTGTIKLQAVFKNEHHILFPNQFVNIHLKIKTIKDAVTVPNSAIQYGPKGNFVYLIENNQAKIHYITIGPSHDNNIMVESGLTKDQIVAISGVDKLVDGAIVYSTYK